VAYVYEAASSHGLSASSYAPAVKRRVTVSVSGEVLEAVRRRAGQRTLSSVVEEALTLYLNLGEKLTAVETAVRQLETLLRQCMQKETGPRGQPEREEARDVFNNAWVEILRRRQGLSTAGVEKP